MVAAYRAALQQQYPTRARRRLAPTTRKNLKIHWPGTCRPEGRRYKRHWEPFNGCAGLTSFWRFFWVKKRALFAKNSPLKRGAKWAGAALARMLLWRRRSSDASWKKGFGGWPQAANAKESEPSANHLLV